MIESTDVEGTQRILFEVKQMEVQVIEYEKVWDSVWNEECKLERKDEFILNQKIAAGDFDNLSDIRFWIEARINEIKNSAKKKIKKLK